jgi:hypothetical protein
MTATNLHNRPLPELLGRKDKADDLGAWAIKECKPVRGAPMTSVVDRVMNVPHGDEALDRVVRAHEMVHAKVSPADDFPKWIERGIATETALRTVEEVRVNYLVKKAGFDVSILADGSELSSGVLLAERNDWASCVYTAVGYAICGGGKDFLTGVRRVNRAWGATLRDIVKRVEKEMKDADKGGDLASTEVDARTGLAPRGFSHTERIAEWVDRLANPPKDEDENGEENGDENGDAQGDAQDGDGTQEGEGKETRKKGNGANNAKQGDKPAPIDPKQINPAGRERGAIPTWGKLITHKLPLTRRAKGGLGRKRTANNIGRNPRRIGNALVDPERRVFDKQTKGNGGVVLIDGSGSMSLSHKDILTITENAPGCTVAVYSADRDNVKPNLLILAEKGRMVDKLPDRNGGNGVDGEAIRWAIKQRQRSSTPVVWITDGQVHGLGNGGQWGGYHDILAMDCVTQALKGNVFVAPDVARGVEVLKDLKNGRKPRKWYPSCWQQTYERLNGRRLGR